MTKQQDFVTRGIKERYTVKDDPTIRQKLINSLLKSQGIDWTSKLGTSFAYGVLSRIKEYKYIVVTQKGFGPDFYLIFFDDAFKIVKIVKLANSSHEKLEELLVKLTRSGNVTWLTLILWLQLK